MTTFVGTQIKFLDALKELVELDYDAVEAYDAAINRIQNTVYKNQLKNFKEDHQRHIKELNELLTKHGESQVTSPGLKQWITKGKIILADIMGDKAILQAMKTNEEDMNVAYEAVNKHDEIWPDAVNALSRGLEDEKRHKKWIEESLATI
jgi:rubrerythrin